MRKNLLSLLILLSMVSFAALAGTLKTYTYPELSLQAPAGLTVKKWNFKEDFPTAGCCYLGAKQLSVMVVTGQLPDQMTMLNTMVKLTGVKLNGWMLADQAQNDMRGWVWRREYSVVLGGKTVAYTVLGHGAQDAYLIVLCTDTADFSAHQKDYQAWRDSLRVPPNSNPDKPR